MNLTVPIILVDKVPAYYCTRCKYKWFPKGLNPDKLADLGKKPHTCSKCRNAFWDEEPRDKESRKQAKDTLPKTGKKRGQ